MKPVRLFACVAALSLAFVFAGLPWASSLPWANNLLGGSTIAIAATPDRLSGLPSARLEPVAQEEASLPAAPLPIGGAEAVPVAAVAPNRRLDALESHLLAQLNEARAANLLVPLLLDVELTRVARARSADMLARGYFAHTTPDGSDVYVLMAERKLSARFAGENLARNNWDDVQSPVRAVTGFLGSAPHRLNLLNALFSHVGVGAALAPDGMKIYTVVFAGN